MRLHTVMRYVAFALLLNAIFMFISAMLSLGYDDGAFLPLMYSALLCMLFGLFPLIFVPPTTSITNKEGLLIVVLSWLISCLAGSLPYILWGGPFTLTNAWFESVSGFTTTGSTILINIEALPMSLLFWRAATHWLGGIGIIIFVLAVLPFVGIAEVVLFRNEISSIAQNNFHQRTRKTIQILAGVYIGLTAAQTVALMLCGMNLFDAITHSFATIATGGFSPKNASIAYYNSPLIEIVTMLFMVLSGIHFGLLFAIVTGKVHHFWRSSVVRAYLLFMFFGVMLSTIDIWMSRGIEFLSALRQAAFNIISVGTSTGFANADTNLWPAFSQLMLIFFALQCACSGSTSGGIKVDRIVIVIKSFFRQIKSIMHPNAVLPLRMDGQVVSDDTAARSVLYVMNYLIIVFIATVILSLMGVDMLSAFTGTVATMGNVGPGLGSVGSVGNFAAIPNAGKWVFSATMLLGRLEIYALFIFFTKSQWRDRVTY